MLRNGANMNYSEIMNAKGRYKKILDDSKREISRLESEIKESKAAVKEAKQEAKAAALKADNEAYQAAKNKEEMHTQRIEMHTVKIIDLENGHLISADDFKKASRELSHLQNRITNEAAAAFFECIEKMRAISAEYEKQMADCNQYGAFLQESVYREYDKYKPNEIAHRIPSGMGYFNTITGLFGAPNNPWSFRYADMERRAGNVRKARIAKESGLDEKAEQLLNSL